MAARVLFVTGKGGTGKSIVAEALAREAASRGTRVLLVRMGRAADAGPPRPSQIRPRPPAHVHEKTLDAGRDLEAFLTRVLGLGFVARRLGESRVFSAVAAAAPGLRDLVALAAIATEASRRRGLVIVDAPASGHSVPMLSAPERVLELAPLGPVAREVARTRRLVRDAACFTAVLVTTPEELAINEVLELHEDVRAAGVASVRVVVNGVWPSYATPEDAQAIAGSGVSADATLHWRRHLRHAEMLERLEQRAGRSMRIGFSFEEGTLPASDVALLLASLDGASP